MILHDEGERGGPDPPKKDDIIYEQPFLALLSVDGKGFQYILQVHQGISAL